MYTHNCIFFHAHGDHGNLERENDFVKGCENTIMNTNTAKLVTHIVVV